MIRYSVVALAIIACCTNAAAQKTIIVAPPHSGNLPSAFAREGNNKVTLNITEDGAYALAYTLREAKAWKLPSGELIYRFQTGHLPGDKLGVYSRQIRGLRITDDGKYIYPTEASAPGRALEAADLATGEMIPDGLLLDSLKSGAYHQRHGAALQPASVGREKTSLLLVPRDYDNGGRDEGVTIIASSADLTHPGQSIICYKQEHCGSKEWIKTSTLYSVKELREKQKKSNHCQYYDYHVARYNPAAGKVTYIGNMVSGVEQANYQEITGAVPSPFADVVYVRLIPKDGPGRHAFYSTTGKELWQAGDWSQCDFERFDISGNAVIRETDAAGHPVVSVRNSQNGEVITRYVLPDNKKDLQIIDQWGMYADVQPTADTKYTIGIYDIKDGRRVMSLTDEEGATAFATRYKKEADAWEAERLARIRANEEAWAWNVRENAAANEAYRKKNMAAAAEHNKYFMTCPRCNGVGYLTSSGYSRGSSSSTTGTRQNTITGEVTGVRTTTTTAGGMWYNAEKCPRCKGRKEVNR